MIKDTRSDASNPDLEDIRGALRGEWRPQVPELSVAQDERGAFEVWIESVPSLTWENWGRREAAHAAWQARAASTSANAAAPAQSGEPVAWREEAQRLFDRCKLWPERTDDGFMALLELRNHVEKLLNHSADLPAQTERALTAALEESNSLLAAMLHEQRPRDEIEAQIADNRKALTAAQPASGGDHE